MTFWKVYSKVKPQKQPTKIQNFIIMINKHKPTKKQEKLFQNVIKAMEKCKEAGLEFYGKQTDLVAYRREVANYFRNSTRHPSDFSGEFVPCLEAYILYDSGADDEWRYPTTEEEHKLNN